MPTFDISTFKEKSDWMFETKSGRKVIFYPTKNDWRFADSSKRKEFRGNIKKFFKWLKVQE